MKEKFPDPCKAKPNDREKQRIQENAIIFKKGKEKLGADFQVGESSKTAPDRRVEALNRNGANYGSYASAIVNRRRIEKEIQRCCLRRTQTKRVQLELQSMVQLTVSLQRKSGLTKAWVGRLWDLAVFDRLEKELMWSGGIKVKPKYFQVVTWYC